MGEIITSSHINVLTEAVRSLDYYAPVCGQDKILRLSDLFAERKARGMAAGGSF